MVGEEMVIRYHQPKLVTQIVAIFVPFYVSQDFSKPSCNDSYVGHHAIYEILGCYDSV